ncbi:SAM-dependent methyltransferase [Actinoplanes hulinensis]|uniref:SAM-dependent methyltransferase n=1 Tax=Actinoplanes hulinensis TaxID=1144547 RepID=A0ABS7B0V8_9ACTN|nr:SAM-dependent methyltransferase [Actinoplanes hulinensis]MBW6434542.1 SAM-dependent methyltransferase [Actinoplanes hulinensis]
MSIAAEPPIDPNRPSTARIADVFLGGTHNFASDRAVAARAIELLPEVPAIARANRAFLRRAVRYAAGRGIRQFLDLGSGIPSANRVHEAARDVAPDARVLYVDIDPTAVLYARHQLESDPGAAAVHGDLLRPAALLDEPEVQDLLDLDQPLAVLLSGVLHFLPDGPDLDAALAAYREAVAPGSVLAISHVTPSDHADLTERFTALYNRTETPLTPREPDEVARFFAGWRLVEPGLVYCPEWRPDPDDEPVSDPARFVTLGGVGER